MMRKETAMYRMVLAYDSALPFPPTLSIPPTSAPIHPIKQVWDHHTEFAVGLDWSTLVEGLLARWDRTALPGCTWALDTVACIVVERKCMKTLAPAGACSPMPALKPVCVLSTPRFLPVPFPAAAAAGTK